MRIHGQGLKPVCISLLFAALKGPRFHGIARIGNGPACLTKNIRGHGFVAALRLGFHVGYYPGLRLGLHSCGASRLG